MTQVQTTLQFKAPSTTVTDAVEIEITSSVQMGGDDDRLWIAFWLPTNILPSKLSDLSDGEDDLLLTSADHGVTVKGGGDWQAWFMPNDGESVLGLCLKNDQASPWGTIDSAHPLTVSFPVEVSEQHQVKLPPLIGTAKKAMRNIRLNQVAKQELVVTVAPAGSEAAGKPPEKTPGVWLTPSQRERAPVDADGAKRVFHESPTALVPGTEIEVSWGVERGVSGKLKGPLSGGRRELDLVKGVNLASGSETVRVISTQIYVLEATVEISDTENRKVTLTLPLDAATDDKFGYLKLLPSSVLPFGKVSAHWWLWGVEETGAALRIDYPHDALTPTTPTSGGDGVGVFEFVASETGPTKVELQAKPLLGVHSKDTPASIDIPNLRLVTWKDWTVEPRDSIGTTAPVAMSYAVGGAEGSEGALALITASRQLFLAEGMEQDRRHSRADFERVQGEAGESWLSVAACPPSEPPDANKPPSFIAIRKLDRDQELELIRTRGKDLVPDPPGIPGHRDCDTARVVTLFDRAYVVAAEPLSGPTPVPLSFSLSDQKWRLEPALLAAVGKELVAVEDAIFAFDRSNGELLRFDLPSESDGDRALLPPTLAAIGQTSTGGEKVPNFGSPVGGALVAVGGLLVVLGDEKSQARLRLNGKLQEQGPQDWVYDPQSDNWIPCGHGLTVSSGVAAYRPDARNATTRLFFLGEVTEGESARFLAFNSPDGHLFSPDHFRGNPSQRPKTQYLGESLPFPLFLLPDKGTSLRLDPDCPIAILFPVFLLPDKGTSLRLDPDCPIAILPDGSDRALLRHRKGKLPKSSLQIRTPEPPFTFDVECTADTGVKVVFGLGLDIDLQLERWNKLNGNLARWAQASGHTKLQFQVVDLELRNLLAGLRRIADGIIEYVDKAAIYLKALDKAAKAVASAEDKTSAAATKAKKKIPKYLGKLLEIARSRVKEPELILDISILYKHTFLERVKECRHELMNAKPDQADVSEASALLDNLEQVVKAWESHATELAVILEFSEKDPHCADFLKLAPDAIARLKKVAKSADEFRVKLYLAQM